MCYFRNCIFFVLKWRKWRKWRIYFCMWKKFYKKSKEQNGKTKKYLYMIYMVRYLRDLRDFPRCGDVKSWQNIIIQICHDPGCKILNHINFHQKTAFFDQRISEKYHFYPYFCIFFVLKWRIYPINHTYIYTGEK